MSQKQSEARLKMLHGPGRIYFAYSRYCDWLKLGFTSKPVAERIEKLAAQYPEFGPFSLLGSVPSTWDCEQQLHGCFTPFRGRRTGRTRELYPAVPELVVNAKNLVTHREWKLLSSDRAWLLLNHCTNAAQQKISKIEIAISYERFYAERRAA